MNNAGRIADLQEVDNTNPHPLAALKYSHLRVEMPDGKEIHLLFTENEIREAIKRAERNQEDLPKVSWLRDITD